MIFNDPQPISIIFGR